MNDPKMRSVSFAAPLPPSLRYMPRDAKTRETGAIYCDLSPKV